MKAKNYEVRANRILDRLLCFIEAIAPNYNAPDLKIRRGLIEELPAFLNNCRQAAIGLIDPKTPIFSDPLTESQMQYLEKNVLNKKNHSD